MTRAPSGAERIENWLGPAGAAYSIIKPIVDFLSHPLDQVTGDPDALAEKARAWRDAAAQLDRLAEAELGARTDLLSYWEGEAAEAFSAEMAQVNQSLTEIGDHFEGTAQLLEGSAEGARQAQELVEQIVRELIAWLIVTIIVALASSWITLGASVAAGAAAGAVEAGLAGTRAAAVAVKLANLLRKVAAFLKKMSDFAKAYKLTRIRSVGVQNWASARYASSTGYQLLATN
ncbi:MAG TPA: WXG100 family type VII secretion target, partial [Micromonospora sp.]